MRLKALLGGLVLPALLLSPQESLALTPEQKNEMTLLTFVVVGDCLTEQGRDEEIVSTYVGAQIANGPMSTEQIKNAFNKYTDGHIAKFRKMIGGCEGNIVTSQIPAFDEWVQDGMPESW